MLIFVNVMKYSIIIPVYNRPDEVGELLESIASQPRPDVEVIVVEDGSTVDCKEVVAKFENRLQISYLVKENGGPAMARNYGAQHASGEWLLILDSDVVLPPNYFEAVDSGIENEQCDAFGGPDCAADSFTPVQKAISYAMTSFFTTGGIRGGKKDGQVLSPFLQHGHTQRGLRKTRRLLANAFRRRHRFQLPHS